MAKTYYEKNKDKILRRLKERYQEDKEFRDKARETYRERYHTDPEYRTRHCNERQSGITRTRITDRRPLSGRKIGTENRERITEDRKQTEYQNNKRVNEPRTKKHYWQHGIANNSGAWW